MAKKYNAREKSDEKSSNGIKGRMYPKTMRHPNRKQLSIHSHEGGEKRRDKINQRMKTLQKLVPNSSKTDKASMLDEVIEYLKQLQAQVQMMMSRMNMMMMQTTPTAAATLMLPMAMQQQQQQQQLLQMSTMMAPMMSIGGMMGTGNLGLGGMGNVFGINTNTINNGRSNLAVPHQLIHPSANFVPSTTMATNWMDGTSILPDHHHPFSAFFPSQPMTMDAYTRMAAMYQQALHQPPPSTSKS